MYFCDVKINGLRPPHQFIISLKIQLLNIQEKTLQDLEFNTVLAHISNRCVTLLGKEAASHIIPNSDREVILKSLGETNEYLSSFSNDNRIPNHGFEDIETELKLLKIENTTLELQGFKKIVHICEAVNAHKKFFEKFNLYYPLLFKNTLPLSYQTDIPERINFVFDKFGEIRDAASGSLQQIRRQMLGLKSKINQSFSAAMQRYQTAEFLDEIRESIVDNRRVLAVKAMHRKKIKGAVLGASKTGSIVYIVPEASLAYSTQLSNLLFEEQEEIFKILNRLTLDIKPYREELFKCQDYLTQTDIIAAKAKYANEMNAIMPKVNTHNEMMLRDAFHPLLYLSNKASGNATYPQTIGLENENRIIVISGPNAGGKSITLKTIGLLQLMVQSGLLIPVHERSEVCLFDKILTDIGDNQSIENHLSTYSYRLKNMNSFLKKCNDKTLFLIDEFGTGTDPELGGALAETFLEVFYERKAFGIITTHYSNLKMLANELPYMSNANMLFDAMSLAPTFQLVLGQAGASFTFEVAQKNGIPYSLINKAKKKIERGKIRFDATIAKLQIERSQMAATGSKLKDEESKARIEAHKLQTLNEKIQAKLVKYQELYDQDQRMIQLGNKLNDIAEQYFINNKKRPLVSEIIKLVEIENSKRKKKSTQVIKKEREEKLAVVAEITQEVAIIREKKKKEKQKPKVLSIPKVILKIGHRVRLLGGKAVGTIDSLEKNKAIVNYGLFTTNVSVDQLEFVSNK
ncbi:MAG: DNA mismatch repair protein MutS2 [Arcticibacterium sp.]